MLGLYDECGVNTYKNTPIYSHNGCSSDKIDGVSIYKNAPIYSETAMRNQNVLA